MLKNLSLLVFALMLIVNVTFSQSNVTLNAQQKSYYQSEKLNVVVVGDAEVTSDIMDKLHSGKLTEQLNSAPVISAPFRGVFTPNEVNAFWTSAVVTPMGGASFYGQQSNGTTAQIWQDPSNANNIHACFTTAALDGDPAFPTRNVGYYFTSNKGANWAFVINVSSTRAGFGAINGNSDGNAMVTCHTGTTTRSKVFVDVAPGVGAFTELDPYQGVTSNKIWPRVVATQSTSLANKFVLVASINGTPDSTFWTTGQSLSSSVFNGWHPMNSNSAEAYSLARGSDGRIGCAYISQDANDPTDQGDVFFMESVNNGTSFGTPQKIYDANPSVDTLGALRGISIVYQGTTPKVVFEIAHTDASGFYPGLPSKIAFWSPTVNAGNIKIIADKNNAFSGPRTGPSNVLVPLSRPSIGASLDGTAIFVTFMAQDTVYRVNGTDTTSYSFLYLMASNTGGNSFKAPERLTPRTSPAKEWNQPSISPTNDNDAANYYVNISCAMDDVPFSAVTAPDPLTNERNEHIRVTIPRVNVAVTNISSEVPATFTLKQNFPNPFNPTTNIRFDVPRLSNVTVKVYNVSGQLVETLVNNELLPAGVKEVNFNASSLSSGIYFYTLTAGDFKETKKMMLVK